MVNNSNITLALILGSGIEINDNIISEKEILKEDNSGVHKKLVYSAVLNGKKILVFKGRRHFYEGFTAEEILSNIEFADTLGVKNLLLTNAAGGLNENFNEGDLMLITSHLNFINRIKNKAVSSFYNRQLAETFKECCRLNKVKIQEGSYGCYTGPNYETSAEVRFQKKMNLDAAGMSTVPEVIYARTKKMNLIAVSVITNLLKENTMVHTSHESVLDTASTASENLNKVLPSFISELN